MTEKKDEVKDKDAAADKAATDKGAAGAGAAPAGNDSQPGASTATATAPAAATAPTAAATKPAADKPAAPPKPPAKPDPKIAAKQPDAEDDAARAKRLLMEDAGRKSKIAQQARREATSAVARADKLEQEATAALAAAEGRLLCHVPVPFRVTMDGGRIVEVPAGTQTLPEDVARHWYAERVGVKVVGLPAPDKKA